MYGYCYVRVLLCTGNGEGRKHLELRDNSPDKVLVRDVSDSAVILETVNVVEQVQSGQAPTALA